MGLPKINRLHRRDFRSIYQRGLSRQSSHLKIRAIPARSPTEKRSVRDRKARIERVGASLPPSQFGISLGRKVSKKAVERNRMKRQLRAAIRHLLPTLSPGWKTIVIVKPGAIECKYEHFLRELEELLSQAEAVDGH
ncbi:MAG: ribonuclease P protein component [Cyanobacteriota bacterium]|nr:ribonuclease P protein component [Cyanobacteriota bacterium]